MSKFQIGQVHHGDDGEQTTSKETPWKVLYSDGCAFYYLGDCPNYYYYYYYYSYTVLPFLERAGLLSTIIPIGNRSLSGRVKTCSLFLHCLVF
jgi:hypothetical protein